MKQGRKKTEEIIRILGDSEWLAIDEACRKHGVSQTTLSRWKKHCGGMGVKEAQRLRELEKENAELKKIVADQLLETKALKIALEKPSEPGASAQHRRQGGSCLEVFRESGLPVAGHPPVDLLLSPEGC